jgi:hypothetical protein
MTKTRTHFTFRVDIWTPDGESIVEHIAGVEDYQVALATFRAALTRAKVSIGTPALLLTFGSGAICGKCNHERFNCEPLASSTQSRRQ